MTTESQIKIFQTADGQIQLDVSLDQDTVWLSQAQMTELFGRERSVITKHINNIFKEGELVEKSNVQKMHIANSDKPVAFFSLDVIISVGYRVKSQRGVQFRQWASTVLKQFLVEGYSLNQRRLQERGIEFEQVLVTDAGATVLGVVSDYARSWSLLQAYDEQSLQDVADKQSEMRPLELDTVLDAIQQLKQELMRKGEATDLFGQLRGDGLHSAVATIEQSFRAEFVQRQTTAETAVC